MRIPASLHIAAGVALLYLVVFTVSVEGKRVERKEVVKNEDVKKEESNSQVQPKSPIFSFIRRLFPNPEKTLETLKAVAATARPRAKSMQFNKSKSDLKDSKGKKNAKKEKPVPVKRNGKPAVGMSRLRLIPTTKTTTAKPKKIAPKKTSVTTKVTSTTTTTTTKTPKPKSGKFIKDRLRTAGTPNGLVTPPAARDMEVLTYGQKRDRLRQELVKETEDNCLAKILCGGGSGKPKPKEKNTFMSDTAYLIKEFFNIFDFTVDGYGEFDKKKEIDTPAKKTSGDKPQNDEEADEEEEDDDADDEDEEIYRKDQVNDAAKNKYTTNKPKRPAPQQQTSKQPLQAHKTRTSKPMAAFVEEIELPTLTRRPKPVVTTTKKTTTTTSTTTEGTTSTTTSRPKEDSYLSGGDMAPVKYNKLNKNRVGEAVTLSSNDVLTSSMISTSISGSATLKPLDTSFEIPLKTAKDSSDDDDDEEDDNNKYTDDRYEDNDDDSSTYHRVTLEELVGDIKLTAADLAMLRRGRSMKLNVNNMTSDRYIKSKLRQLKQVNNEVTKLRIAQKIGRSMREPRQCRQFSQVAQEVLQTCPLTTEVIRFFNANLKNNSSIEVKRTPPSGDSTGGLVLLSEGHDGSNQAFLVDNSPPSSNINLESDLKNPSVPSTYGKDEVMYPVYEKRPNPNPQNSNLNQHGQDITKRPAPTKDEKEGDSDEEQDDDGDSDEDEDEDEEDQDEVEARQVQYEDAADDDGDDEEEDDYDDNSTEDDEDGSDDDSNKKIKVQGNHEQIQGTNTNQPNVKVAFRPQAPKRPAPQGPTLPPGIIRVYGVPQASFDKDFTTLADQLGPKPVTFFGEEDIDRPAYKRRRQLAIDEDDEKEDLENVPFNSRNPKHPPLESEPVNDGDDDDDDAEVTKKPYQSHKKNNALTSGKPLGGVKGADGDDDDDDDDDDKKSGEKKKGHSIESVDLNESPFSTSGFYNPSQAQYGNHDYFHHQQPSHHQNHYPQHHQGGYQHHQNAPHNHYGYGYRPIVRPIQIIPEVPPQFRPTRSHMRPGRLYPVYGKK